MEVNADMPKNLDEFRALQETEARQGGRKVNWKEVFKVIIDLGTEKGVAFNAKEIWEREDMVNKRVTQYRTINALNKAFEDGIIDRRYDDKRYWFGPKTGGKRRERNRKKS